MNRKHFLSSGVIAALAMGGANHFSKVFANTSGLQPFYLPPDPTPLDPANGVAIRTKVRSSQTNMQFSSVDIAIAPKTMGPAPHVHKELDELMYVHQGTVHVLVGKQVFEVKSGGWHFRPRGIVHTFWNASDEIARCTDMYFNQNFEDFLEELYFKILPDMKSRNLTPFDAEIKARIQKLDAKFGITTFPEERQPIVQKYGLK